MSQENNLPTSQGKFIDLTALIDYEKRWHKLIYEPAKTNLKNEVCTYTSYMLSVPYGYSVSSIDFTARKSFF